MPAKKHGFERRVQVTSAEDLQKQIWADPEIQAVLEIAARARETEATQPAGAIGIATDVVATPSNAQCPV